MEEKIKQAIEGVFELPSDWLTSGSRKRDISVARYIFIYLVRMGHNREGVRLSGNDLSERYNRDRQIIDYGIRKVNILLESDGDFANMFDRLHRQVFGVDDCFAFFINGERIGEKSGSISDFDKIITIVKKWKSDRVGKERYTPPVKRERKPVVWSSEQRICSVCNTKYYTNTYDNCPKCGSYSARVVL